jgi:hypothetical protein
MKTCVDTTQPVIPQTIGRNYKRYENEQQRNETIIRDNRRLLGKMGDIQRQEHYPRAIPQRPYTLMGQAQKDEMRRITHENRKILTAVQERRPILNRNDWLHHRLDHEYQITKMAEYKTTVPMGEIIRQEGLKSRPSTADGSVTSKYPPSPRPPDQEDGRYDEAPPVEEEDTEVVDEPMPDVIGDILAGDSEGPEEEADTEPEPGQSGAAPDADSGPISDPDDGATPPGESVPEGDAEAIPESVPDDEALLPDVIGDTIVPGDDGAPEGDASVPESVPSPPPEAPEAEAPAAPEPAPEPEENPPDVADAGETGPDEAEPELIGDVIGDALGDMNEPPVVEDEDVVQEDADEAPAEGEAPAEEPEKVGEDDAPPAGDGLDGPAAASEPESAPQIEDLIQSVLTGA